MKIVKPSTPNTHSIVRRFAPLLLLAMVFTAFYGLGLQHYASFEGIQTLRIQAESVFERHPVLLGFGYVAAYALCTAFSLPIASFLTLLAGAIFGLYWGTAIVAVGATAGACAIFLYAKTAAGDVLRKRAGRFYQKAAAEMAENALFYLLFIRLVPLMPFVVANILPALFHVKLRTYALTTFFGILPGTAVFVNLGRNLATLKSTDDLFSSQTFMAFFLLGCLVLVPLVYKKLFTKKAPH